PPVLLQTKITTGGRNKLPYPGGTAMGIGKRLEGAFHNGQQGQFTGYAAGFNLFSNKMQIPHTALGDTVKVILMGLIPVQLRVDAWVAAVQIQLVRSDNALPDILVSGLRLSFRLPVVKQGQAVFGTALFLGMSIGAGNAAAGAQKSQRCCRQEE